MATKVSPITKAKQDLVLAQKAMVVRQKKYDNEAKAARDSFNLDMLGLTASVAAAKAVVDALTAQASAISAAKATPRIMFGEVEESVQVPVPSAQQVTVAIPVAVTPAVVNQTPAPTPPPPPPPAKTPVPAEDRGWAGIKKGLGLK